MKFLENEKCPVCNRCFEEGDDVVFCPECGTPHHRECYQLSGHCVNEGLHTAGFVYERKTQLPPVSQPTPESPRKSFFAPAEAEDDNPQDMPVPPLFSPFGAYDPAAAYEKETQTVGGEHLSDIAATVRSNVARFIAVFRRQEASGSKRSWNWGAFLFGAYYYFYRKLYRGGILLMAIMLSVNVGGSALLAKLAPASVSLMAKVAASNSVAAYEELSSQLSSAPDYHKFAYIVMLTALLNILINVMAAMFFDYFYKLHIINIIKNVSQTLEDGASFKAAGTDAAAYDLSQEQMRRLYLARKGGVSFVAPMLAMSALYFLNWLTSNM